MIISPTNAITYYSLGQTVAVVTPYGYAEFMDYRAASEFSESLHVVCALTEFVQALMRKGIGNEH